jgi:hypothetical protein
VGALDGLQGVGAEQDDVEVCAIAHLPLELGVGGLGGVVVGAEAAHLGLPGGDVIDDQEVLVGPGVLQDGSQLDLDQPPVAAHDVVDRAVTGGTWLFDARARADVG